MAGKAQGYFHRVMAKHLHKRLVSSAEQPPIVSFTFDDIHTSAAGAGASILAQCGVKGTFYVAMSCLAGEEGNKGLFEIDDVRRLIGDGHEIGCHTWGHIRACGTSVDNYLKDIAKNAERFSDVFPGYRLANFSYPFGDVTTALKVQLAPLFRSLRGIRPGINGPRADLNLLLSNNLYNSCMDMERVSQLIAEAQRLGGWLLFCTHDVMADPSRFGCTPDFLKAAVELTVESGCRVMTVDKALNELGVP